MKLISEDRCVIFAYTNYSTIQKYLEKFTLTLNIWQLPNVNKKQLLNNTAASLFLTVESAVEI